jgi:hypothetical protein
MKELVARLADLKLLLLQKQILGGKGVESWAERANQL